MKDCLACAAPLATALDGTRFCANPACPKCWVPVGGGSLGSVVGTVLAQAMTDTPAPESRDAAERWVGDCLQAPDPRVALLALMLHRAGWTMGRVEWVLRQAGWWRG